MCFFIYPYFFFSLFSFQHPPDINPVISILIVSPLLLRPPFLMFYVQPPETGLFQFTYGLHESGYLVGRVPTKFI